MTSSTKTQRKALVTGANGYIGQAVALAFQRAGFVTYGLIRPLRSTAVLEKHSVIPVIGSAANIGEVLTTIKAHTTTLDVIVSTTDDPNDYGRHFNDTMALFRALARSSNEQGIRPLVLYTSGCKDYGQGELDGSSSLVMHTEDSPLNPPSFLAARSTHALKALQEDAFDAAVLRPTNVHGGSSSHLGHFFDMAEAAKNNNEALRFRGDPRVIVHSMNIDDCADAYVALVNHPDRAAVSGECFNISAGRRYETLKDIGNALINVYGIQRGLIFDSLDSEVADAASLLTNFSQYVGSEKLRKLTQWSDRNPMFAQGLTRYRDEYEEEKGRK